jgi:hypothetical protein
LFCGLGGWTEGLLAEGYRVVGFDIERHRGPGGIGYPAQLVLQDVLTIHGSQFRDAALIVASPPCQSYSYLAMPWSRSKSEHSQKAKALRRKWETEGPDNRLFDACFRIQREACEAKSTALGCWVAHDDWCCPRCFIPLVVENVRGAQPWVGRSAWNYGSFHLWGDVPALMPINLKRGQKVPGFRFDGSGKSFQTASVEGTKANPDGTNHPRGSWLAIADSSQGDRRETKNEGGSWFGVANNKASGHGRNPVNGPTPQARAQIADGEKTTGHVNQRDGYSREARDEGSSARFGSKSNARKMASAMIAKIPFRLALHIAETYYPRGFTKDGAQPSAEERL